MSKGWQHTRALLSRNFICAFCSANVGSDKGFSATIAGNAIYICPMCGEPNYFAGDKQFPGVMIGNDVGALPDDVGNLYREARRCLSVASATSAVLTCRKLLMNVAVSQGAPANQTFISYVEYLSANGYVPPKGKGWVDHIRKKGNEANHEIKLMAPADAVELILFLEMLLKFIYEFPSKIPPPST